MGDERQGVVQSGVQSGVQGKLQGAVTGVESWRAPEAETEGTEGSESAEVLGRVKVSGARCTPEIPERIIKKLAKIAGLEYAEKAPEGGGGLCLGIEGIKRRRKALMVLGAMVGHLGQGSMDRAIVGWREDGEYARLWGAAVRTRREVAAARLEDTLWERCTNGYMVEEAKSTREGIERVKVRKYDNVMGVQLLKGLGYVGKDSGVRKTLGGKGAEEPAGREGGEGAAGAPADTVLFADRKTAFEMMGTAPGTAGKE
jgi:hypothetical protein